MNKTAIITGVGGQDGAYLSELLLNKGYKVIGCHRNKLKKSFWRLIELGIQDRIILEYLDLQHHDVIENLIYRYQPDEFYNLAGLSSVSQSFKDPKLALDINGVAVTKILEAIRTISPNTKFYQASSSEMYGKVDQLPISEKMMFHPLSPYAAAKIFAHNLTSVYREAYDLFTCCGILFNHESPLRGDQFVTSKIINGVQRIRNGGTEPLTLGNIYAQRDWGYAKDYVLGMWKMMQQEKPDDYILATGIVHSVKNFVNIAFSSIGIDLEWRGSGVDEIALDRKTDRILVRISEEFYRPTDIDIIYGNAEKAFSHLNWKPSIEFTDLINIMIEQKTQTI